MRTSLLGLGGLVTLAGASGCAPSSADFPTRLDPPARPAEVRPAEPEPLSSTRVPLSLDEGRELAWRFLRALEARADDYEPLLCPEARVRSKDTGRVRSLRSAWNERRTTSPAPPSALGPRLELSDEMDEPDELEGDEDRPSRLTFLVIPQLVSAPASGVPSPWYLVLEATARGPRVLEVRTSDGLLP